jgi:hypothetical protein
MALGKGGRGVWRWASETGGQAVSFGRLRDTGPGEPRREWWRRRRAGAGCESRDLWCRQTHVMSTRSGPVLRPSGRTYSLMRESRGASPLSSFAAACHRNSMTVRTGEPSETDRQKLTRACLDCNMAKGIIENRLSLQPASWSPGLDLT